MSSRLYWQQAQNAYRARTIVWLVTALVALALLWSALAKLDEVVVGEGVVVPAQAVQKIQSLEGGILTQVTVREGQVVEPGYILAVLDDTRFRAQYQEAQQEQQALLSKRSRLAAELQTVVFDPQAKLWRDEIQVKPQIIQNDTLSETVLTSARASYAERVKQIQGQLNKAGQQIEQQKQAYDEAVRDTQTLFDNLSLVSEEVELTRDVVATGAVARVELLKLQREESNVRGDLAASKISQQRLAAARDQAVEEYRNIALAFRSEAQEELVELDGQLARLIETMAALKDQLQRTQVKAPVRGKVKNIATRSRGGVIAPGEAMMEVVPLDDQLIIETRLAPQDMAFVREGLQATVKFTAYDFVIYGGLKGEVIYVSPDAQQDEDGVTYFEAHIKTAVNHLHTMPIIPGMQAGVDILTGQKTVLDYWLKPLLRARATAMREP